MYESREHENLFAVIYGVGGNGLERTEELGSILVECGRLARLTDRLLALVREAVMKSE
jgi:hypothetical protein